MDLFIAKVQVVICGQNCKKSDMQTPDRADLLPLLADLNAETFDAAALAILRYQAACNPVFSRYLELLGRDVPAITQSASIPFLPIRFFLKRIPCKAATGSLKPPLPVAPRPDKRHRSTSCATSIFTCPTPAKALRSATAIRRTGVSSRCCPPTWSAAARRWWLMADHFIRLSRYPESGFFLHEPERLQAALHHCKNKQIPTVLLGVSFALLDFAERRPMILSGIVVMETAA